MIKFKNYANSKPENCTSSGIYRQKFKKNYYSNKILLKKK